MSEQAEETLSERDQALVSLFLGTQRGVEAEAIARLVGQVLVHGESPGNIADVAVLVMHGRWCRGGKGERTASLHALSALFTHSPRAVAAIIQLLPHYGCWKDLLELGATCPGVQVVVYPCVLCCWSLHVRNDVPLFLSKFCDKVD